MVSKWLRAPYTPFVLAIAIFFLVLRIVGYFALALFAADTVARAFKQVRGGGGRTAVVAGALCLAGMAAAAAVYAAAIARDTPALDHLMHL